MLIFYKNWLYLILVILRIFSVMLRFLALCNNVCYVLQHKFGCKKFLGVNTIYLKNNFNKFTQIYSVFKHSKSHISTWIFWHHFSVLHLVNLFASELSTSICKYFTNYISFNSLLLKIRLLHLFTSNIFFSLSGNKIFWLLWRHFGEIGQLYILTVYN